MCVWVFKSLNAIKEKDIGKQQRQHHQHRELHDSCSHGRNWCGSVASPKAEAQPKESERGRNAAEIVAARVCVAHLQKYTTARKKRTRTLMLCVNFIFIYVVGCVYVATAKHSFPFALASAWRDAYTIYAVHVCSDWAHRYLRITRTRARACVCVAGCLYAPLIAYYIHNSVWISYDFFRSVYRVICGVAWLWSEWVSDARPSSVFMAIWFLASATWLILPHLQITISPSVCFASIELRFSAKSTKSNRN